MASQYSSQSLNDVTGLVAVVTGGGSGLGAIMAKTLEANGATVYITGRRQEKLEEVAKDAAHGKIIPIQGSVSDRKDIQRAVDVITKDVGYIDLLVCNAGMSSAESGPNARPVPTEETSISEMRDYYFNYRDTEIWGNVLETNVTAVFLTIMGFLELLDAGNKRRPKTLPTSQIITIGSTGGLARGLPNVVYSASKAGVHHLTKSLGTILVHHNIRTNIIAPGYFPTDMTAAVSRTFGGNVLPKNLVPLERMGNADEIAGTILYLASKAGGYANGSVTVIDGGYLVNHAGTF